jgi:glutamate synthase (NADPH/NADH)
MGLNEDFDDRQIHESAESEEYHPYDYQTENNTSWAGALPVKQYVFTPRPLL